MNTADVESQNNPETDHPKRLSKPTIKLIKSKLVASDKNVNSTP